MYLLIRSVLLQRSGLRSQSMLQALQTQLSVSLRGIVHDIVRQKMLDLVVANLHGVVMSDRAKESVVAQLAPGDHAWATASAASSPGAASPQPAVPSSSGFSRRSPPTPPPFGDPYQLPLLSHLVSSPYSLPCRQLPVLQLLELVLGGADPSQTSSVRRIDFGRNKQWSSSLADPEKLSELARILWKIIGERCHGLESLVVPKELSYSSTLNAAIRSNASLTQLTLKRNVPNNMFLSVIGTSCPNLKELDIAGAEVVTDFGVVCLLFADPEQIFIETWNREKTVSCLHPSKGLVVSTAVIVHTAHIVVSGWGPSQPARFPTSSL